MIEIDILKWAAGANNVPPPISSVDEEFLLFATRKHRMAGYFLRRLQMAPQPWANLGLLTKLRALHDKTGHITQDNLSAVREINEVYFPRYKHPAIPMKGFSAYALTGDPATMRPSLDIDITSNDLEGLKLTLSNLGYDVYSLRDGYNYAKMIRGNNFVEIHSYFPLYGFSEPIDAAEVVPERNPRVWKQSTTMSSWEIRYADILAHSKSVAIDRPIEDIIVPDTNMTVFIRCAHTFKHLSLLLPREVAALPLYDIAEICYLTKHPSFRPDSFLQLVDRFNAHYQVHFVAQLLEKYLGFNPLPPLDTEIVGSKDRILIHRYFTFWLDTPWSLDDLIVRSHATQMKNFVDYLGGNIVVAQTESIGKTYAVLCDGAGESLERVITQTPEGSTIPFTLTARSTYESLVLELSVQTIPGDDSDDDPCEYVVFDFGGLGSSWKYNTKDHTWSLGTSFTELSGSYGMQPREVLPTFREDGYSLRMAFDWDSLERLSPDREQVHLVLSVMKWKTFKLSLRSMTMIPLHIVRS